jgi:hypothetical protein
VPAGAEIPGRVCRKWTDSKYRRPAVRKPRKRKPRAIRHPGSRRRFHGELLTLKIRYKEPAGDESRKLEFPLVDAGARLLKTASAGLQVRGGGGGIRDAPARFAAVQRAAVTFADVSGLGAVRDLADDAGGYRSEFLGLIGKAGQVVQ